ncbi:hypothetical protein BGZ73_003611 [Actinomortierella ambigua]|nr:hypothetical protein BGZ73_003611 [Actinomortierella ambigua]
MQTPSSHLTGSLLRHLLLSHSPDNSPNASLSTDQTLSDSLPLYHVFGRIIHKRKLSKKLFFLDVAFMQMKQHPLTQHQKSLAEEPSCSDPEGFQLSHWHEEQEEHKEQDDQEGQQHQQNLIDIPKKLEIISKVPQHTVKDLDTLWHNVHLGSVAKITGRLEISERKKKNPVVAGQPQEDAPEEDESSRKKQWTAIFHCATIETIEPWQGKHTFQPVPGSAEIHTAPSRHHSQQQKRPHPNPKPDATTPKRPGDATDNQESSTRQPCKFWLNSGKCNKENCDLWHERDIAKLKIARRQWVEERIQAKRQISHHTDDPHRSTTKHQHRERSLHFAQWLIQTFSRTRLSTGTGVLDIAGGRGDLSFELQTRQGIPSTIIDPKPEKGFRKWQQRWLNEFKKRTATVAMTDPKTRRERNAMDITEPSPKEKEAVEEEGEEEESDEEGEEDGDEGGTSIEKTLEALVPTKHEYPLQTTSAGRIQAMMDEDLVKCHQDLFDHASILVGLHPDQATEPIVRMALRLGKPFAIIPCCVFSRENPHRRLPRIPQEAVTVDSKQQQEQDTAENDEEKDKTTRPVTSYDDFVQWLMTLHPDIKTTWLNFEGMNRVVYWHGPTEQGDHPNTTLESPGKAA